MEDHIDVKEDVDNWWISDKEKIIKKCKKYVKNKMSSNDFSHDWDHVKRVWKMSKRLITEEEKTNTSAPKFSEEELISIELAALLHDISDYKYNGGDDKKGEQISLEWCKFQNLPDEICKLVSDAVADVSFKGALVETKPLSRVGQIVQDADRLDAMGAIGIARAITYGALHDRKLYDPDEPRRFHTSFEEYKADTQSTLGHFHSKLLLLQDRLHTSSARALGAKRHEIMSSFVQQLEGEWEALF